MPWPEDPVFTTDVTSSPTMGIDAENAVVASAQYDLIPSLLGGGWIGRNYVWGGTARSTGLDCSQFTMMTMQSIYGITLPDGSLMQLNYLAAIAGDDGESIVHEVDVDDSSINYNTASSEVMSALWAPVWQETQVGDLIFLNMDTQNHSQSNPLSRHVATIAGFDPVDGWPLIAHASGTAGGTVIERLPVAYLSQIDHYSSGFLETQADTIAAHQAAAQGEGMRITAEQFEVGGGYGRTFDSIARDVITREMANLQYIGIYPSESGLEQRSLRHLETLGLTLLPGDEGYVPINDASDLQERLQGMCSYLGCGTGNIDRLVAQVEAQALLATMPELSRYTETQLNDALNLDGTALGQDAGGLNIASTIPAELLATEEFQAIAAQMQGLLGSGGFLDTTGDNMLALVNNTNVAGPRVR